MRINETIEDITGGKTFGINDMVKADTRGCEGCSHCCYSHGDTMVLNPYDIYEMMKVSGLTYQELTESKISYHIDGKEQLELPILKMNQESGACPFLDNSERCSIHEGRPGVCRLFPLGRLYDQNELKYFIQPGECIKENLSKVKVKKWIEIPDYNKNKEFLLSWHNLIKALRFRMKFMSDEDRGEVNKQLVEYFYNRQYGEEEDFYDTYKNILAEAKNAMGIL
jgi:Fe-S-cluster containining protein